MSAEGWYMPPPHGIIVAIGHPPDYSGLFHPSFRAEESWPSAGTRLDRESVLYAYSSPVHLPTGLIGDTGCPLYRGTDNAVHAQLQSVWNVTFAIVEEIKLGMSFVDLYPIAARLLDEAGLTNNVYSVNDNVHVNIGHTIPFTDQPLTAADRDVIDNGTPNQLADLVSSSRKFLNAVEPLEITEDLAFTVEPRVNAPGMPSLSFHVTVGFENGKRVAVTEFEPLFELFGMELEHD